MEVEKEAGISPEQILKLKELKKKKNNKIIKNLLDGWSVLLMLIMNFGLFILLSAALIKAHYDNPALFLAVITQAANVLVFCIGFHQTFEKIAEESDDGD